MSRRIFVYRPGIDGASRFGMVDAATAPPLEETQALHAPINSGRFYENTHGPAGEDLGSRRKHRDFQRATGLTASSDFGADYHERKKGEIARNTERTRKASVEQSVRKLNEGYRPRYYGESDD